MQCLVNLEDSCYNFYGTFMHIKMFMHSEKTISTAAMQNITIDLTNLILQLEEKSSCSWILILFIKTQRAPTEV